MKPLFTGLLLIAAAMVGTGCALTETVTPPPPKVGALLPPQARELFSQAVPQCEDPAKAGISVNQQIETVNAEIRRLQSLIEIENTRWEKRRYYLEGELRFYEREVRRTGGNWEYTTASHQPAPLKVSTDGAFIDEVKKQREREYNERQYRRFFRELNISRGKYQQRIGLYQARLTELNSSIEACDQLKMALRKAKEDAALRKNTVAIPNLAPKIKAKTFEAQPLPPEVPEVLPSDATEQTATIQGAEDAQEQLPVAPEQSVETPQAESDFPVVRNHAETMEELLMQQEASPQEAVAETPQEPTTETEESLSDTDDSGSNTEEPATQTAEPVTVPQQPSTETAQPETAPQQPATETAQPETAPQQPSTETVQPKTPAALAEPAADLAKSRENPSGSVAEAEQPAPETMEQLLGTTAVPHIQQQVARRR